MADSLQAIDLTLTRAQIHKLYEECRTIARVEHWNNQAVVEVRLVGGNEKAVGVKVMVERVVLTGREEVETGNAEGRPYLESELLHILSEISQGLVYAKSKAIAHGKISPDKIGMCRDGRYKLVWLQLALVPFLDIPHPTIYDSPEFKGVPTFASDVYSLGMTMLFFAGMREPFPDIDSAKLSGKLASSIQALPYSPTFKSLLTSMLASITWLRPTIEEVSSLSRRPYVHFITTPIPAGEGPQRPVTSLDNMQVDIHDGWLDVFDCEREEWRDAIQVAPLIDVQFSMAFAFLPNAHLFICGGIEPCSPKAWLVSLPDHWIQPQPPMLTPRSEHVAHYAKNAVYVFGGRESDKRGQFTAEKFVFERGRWEPLPSSPYFVCWTTSCLHKDILFIPGGYGTDIVQLFNLITENYSLFDFKLPTAGPTFALIDQDCLVVVQKDWCGRCHLGYTQAQLVETAYQTYWSGLMPAVVCGRRAYLTVSRKEVKALDLNSV